MIYFLTVYFQDVHGYDAMQTAVAFLIPMSAVLIGNALGGRTMTRFGVRATMVGSLGLGVAGTILLGLALSTDGSYAQLVPGLLILSVGQGAIYATMYAAGGQQVGSAVGLAVLVAIANAGTGGRSGEPLRTATTHGLRTAVFVAAGGMALTVLIALRFRPPPRDPPAAASGRTLTSSKGRST